MELLAYRERSAVVVEVPGVIDLDDREAVLAALCAELDRCVDPIVVVRLLEPLITTAGLHVLADAQQYARSLGIELQVDVDQVAEHIFRIAGLDHLLGGR